MGTRGLEIVRFNGRYYVRWHQYDSYYEGLGTAIVGRIPTDPEEYQRWLVTMRAKYASTEKLFEERLFQIRNGVEPDVPSFDEFAINLSELPRLHDTYVDYVYITNLDREVLTMNYTIHWKLSNIPREGNLWISAIVDSIYKYESTISPSVCSEDCMASPAVAIPERKSGVGYESRVVIPRTDIGEPRKALIMFVLAEMLVEYREEILHFGREWDSNSFPFREFIFALVSIASGQASFLSFPPRKCRIQSCYMVNCEADHLPHSMSWLDEKWAGHRAPLPVFGSQFHKPGEPSGASPSGTLYWLEGVLVSLALCADGEAVTNAVSWGIKDGHASFQVVVLSLFEVIFADVSRRDSGKFFVGVSDPLKLSPLRADACSSTHPRERPVLNPGENEQCKRYGHRMMEKCTTTIEGLRTHYPGLAALVNFFEVAGSRRAASSSQGVFPLELYHRIVDFVDYETWKACSLLSTGIRSYCLRKYRFDERVSAVAGPFVRTHWRDKEPLMLFEFENMQSGKTFRLCKIPRSFGFQGLKEWNWMPIIGSDRKVLLLDTTIQFASAESVMEESRDDEEEL